MRDVPFSDGSGLVSNVLVGVCDICDQVCVLPQQSTPAVKRALDKQRKPIESRVPAHMVDILNLASAEISCGTEFVPYLVKYYVHAMSSQKMSASRLPRYLGSDLAKGKAQKRLSLKGQHIVEDVGALKALTHIESTSDLIRGVILKINDDIVQNKRQKPLTELRGIAAAFG